ncbi:MAG: tyrosine-type recombinase/integrase [Planctomycetales bacterium]
MKRFDGLLDRYLEQYEAQGWVPESVANTRRELSRWGQWLKEQRPRPKLEEIDADLITHYLRGRGRFKAKATVRGVMSALRGMGEWLVQREVWSANPLRWMKGPKLDPFSRSPRPIDEEAMEALWRSAAETRSVFARHQWLAVLSILYGTGFRRGEVARLKLDDWNATDGVLRCDGRKTNRERRSLVPEITASCLERYLPHRHNHLEKTKALGQDALFLNRKGEPLKPDAISRGVHRLAKRAEVPLTTLHQFRHTCATALLEAGARVPEVQQALGHQRLETTMRYLHLSDPMRREAIELHPINDCL